jgi:hypothetical protein
MEILNNFTDSQLRRALFFAIEIYLYLDKEIVELAYADAHETDEPGTDFVDISLLGSEGQVIGIDKCVLNNKILIINDNPNNPISGTYLMKFGLSESRNTVFYWTTKMITVWSNQKKEIIK